MGGSPGRRIVPEVSTTVLAPLARSQGAGPGRRRIWILWAVHEVTDREQTVALGIEVEGVHRARERPEAAVHVPDDEVRSSERVLRIGACPVRVHPLKLSCRGPALGSPRQPTGGPCAPSVD